MCAEQRRDDSHHGVPGARVLASRRRETLKSRVQALARILHSGIAGRANDITNHHASTTSYGQPVCSCSAAISMYHKPLRLLHVLKSLPGSHLLKHTESFIPLQSLSSATAARSRTNTLEVQLSAYLQHQYQDQTDHHHNHVFRQQSSRGMSFLMPGFRRGLLLGTPLVLSAPLLAHHLRFAQTIRCDGPNPLTKITNDLTNGYNSEAQVPVVTQSGTVNPRAIRQISMGSILGVLAGVGISIFSKPLAILIGLGIFTLQVSPLR